MPPLASIRTIAEKMKGLSRQIVISANMNGEFTMLAETDLVKIETFYKGLINPQLGKEIFLSPINFIFIFFPLPFAFSSLNEV